MEGGHAGKANIDADPKFRVIQGYDYVLWPDSPCIDTRTGEQDRIDWASIHLRYGDFNSGHPPMDAGAGPRAVGGLNKGRPPRLR